MPVWRAGVSEKEKTELVTAGIYRWSRNPAFLGFDLLYIGFLLYTDISQEASAHTIHGTA